MYIYFNSLALEYQHRNYSFESFKLSNLRFATVGRNDLPHSVITDTLGTHAHKHLDRFNSNKAKEKRKVESSIQHSVHYLRPPLQYYK